MTVKFGPVRVTFRLHYRLTSTALKSPSGNPLMNACEYCQEIRSPSESRFGSIYGGIIDSRVVLRTKTFIVMPTLGQIFKGSLLILPVAHIETLAALSAEQLAELELLLAQVQAQCRTIGHPVFLEHGSTQEAAGSCGIYHAHLHVVPLPTPIRSQELLPSEGPSFARLSDALLALVGTRHYLLAGDGNGVHVVDTALLAEAPGSQFFRRRLVSKFGVNRSWDWRCASEPEDDLLTTIERFRVTQPA